MKKITALISIIFLILSGSQTFAQTSKWQKNKNGGAKVKLITSFAKEDNNKFLLAGLHFKLDDGWKIYGNSVDSMGLPPEIDLSNFQNYQNHEILWPKPQIAKEEFGNEIIQYPIYKKEVILPVKITLKDQNLINNQLNINVTYGLCKEICLPASAQFSINVDSEINPENIAQIYQSYHGTKSANSNKNSSLISLILIAIIGGAILNIMPCVLPVLSIKLISIIKHAKTPVKTIRFAFISTILGILSCFILLAGIVFAAKAAGNSFGWGLQFQNPYFLIFLIIILAFFTANLLGFFEVNFSQFLASLLNKKISKKEQENSIFTPNFLSGILAVLLATPCSAPFLGTAISFALAQDFAIILTIFLAIGLGFSLPYLILLASPKLIYLLPKPGNWMNKLKQILAIFLILTVIWLFYVLSHNIGMIPALGVLGLASSLLICFKLKNKILRNILFAAIIAISFCIPESMNQIKNQVSSNWIKFNEKEISNLVNQGKIVVVDVTADWCITCKFNKFRIFGNQEIKEVLNDENIILMRGDITKPNEKIMQYLAKNNRYAIPFNAVYGPNLKKGAVTKELLGKDELIGLIEKAK